MHTKFEAFAGVALLLACDACTHQMKVTPSFAPETVIHQKPGSICPRGEVVAVSTANKAPDGDSAGTTKAGIHTFNYRFDSDPSQTLKLGLEAALRVGGCRAGSAAAATLQVSIARIEARGLECGFASCEGTAESEVEATLLGRDGRRVFLDNFTSHASAGCGMMICNEKEASAMAREILSEVLALTIDGVADAIRKELASSPQTVPAASETPRAAEPTPPTPAPTAAPSS